MTSYLDPTDTFIHRHIGPRDADVANMLNTLGFDSLEALIDAAVPATIRLDRELDLGPARGEHELLAELKSIASKNEVFRSYIGCGYHGTITPPVIQRNILENPGWYTQYTPYQAEISQGRLEALLNFQTLVSDLTGLPLAGASLLDEATAAAEAMAMSHGITRGKKSKFFVDEGCHPQTIAVVQTRGESMGIEVVLGVADDAALDNGEFCGALLQYPDTYGELNDPRDAIKRVQAGGGIATLAADPLALVQLTSPGQLGADVAVGSMQRYGVPMGFGGPHAAYIATREEFARRLPGRIIGVSKDSQGNLAYRMAIQTREQHIRRERATSNICTAQALLAVMAGMYAVYHGPEGLKRIARRIHLMTQSLNAGLLALGHVQLNGQFFDTLRIRPEGQSSEDVLKSALGLGINLRNFGDGTVGITLDETVSRADVRDLLSALGGTSDSDVDALAEACTESSSHPGFEREGELLAHPIFHAHHSETELLRYLYRLQRRDLSLADSMIPLGSCTMKLNATSEMLPVTWPEFGALHPFVPRDQVDGYHEMMSQLEGWLAEITGFSDISLQPNAGSQGEYTGLLTIRAYHHARGDHDRTICLIPTSAHGTNPASAVIAGMKVVPVKCDERGNIDMVDLRAKAEKYADTLSALMITYPSTHGVFEETIKEICATIHEFGGQVYMDGANLNAQVGLCRPGDMGADVCHLNLHKTFCIPHGGGGPGMGPIGVMPHLAPFLPSHPVREPDGVSEQAIGPVSAAPYSSASILTISWVYIALMGARGLKRATQVAILNANYMAHQLRDHFKVLYTGERGLSAHEFIIDCRPFEKSAGIRIDDIAKRLMDYGFHAPTMAWPVAGTLMIEPTESEPLAELDRFVEALISIREEIAAIEAGTADRADNPLKHAPHTLASVTADEWSHAYSRTEAAWPKAWLRAGKFWPHVGRVDNTWGDRNLVCTCPSMDEFTE